MLARMAWCSPLGTARDMLAGASTLWPRDTCPPPLPKPKWHLCEFLDMYPAQRCCLLCPLPFHGVLAGGYPYGPHRINWCGFPVPAHCCSRCRDAVALPSHVSKDGACYNLRLPLPAPHRPCHCHPSSQPGGRSNGHCSAPSRNARKSLYPAHPRPPSSPPAPFSQPGGGPDERLSASPNPRKPICCWPSASRSPIYSLLLCNASALPVPPMTGSGLPCHFGRLHCCGCYCGSYAPLFHGLFAPNPPPPVLHTPTPAAVFSLVALSPTDLFHRSSTARRVPLPRLLLRRIRLLLLSRDRFPVPQHPLHCPFVAAPCCCCCGDVGGGGGVGL